MKQLTEVNEVNKDTFISRFREFQAAKDVYYIIVVEDLSRHKIVAASSLIIEKKIVRGAGKVNFLSIQRQAGHIEDVVVDNSLRGKNVGKRIISQLNKLGRALGCYKVILDCSEKNVPFYEKCGFIQKEIQMVLYYSSKL